LPGDGGELVGHVLVELVVLVDPLDRTLVGMVTTFIL
jgi:hypothetical protein